MALAVGTSAAPRAAALPIGFGINQGDIEYSEIRSDHFIVYHDRRVPTEGAMTLNALEAVRPTMERWLGQKRHSPLPVVTSAVTDNASFANFITDAIELQTLGQGTKDLAWHEYTHSTMYRAFDNWFGPAGNILHLPWMPAWFLEGLAETTSVSIGSDVTAGIERYQALSGKWPSYDRLHSLYSKIGFAERGYATSGALVTYLLKKGDANKLPAMLDDFYRYSMPWYWPWTVVPFNSFMPMDKALQNFVELDARDLYEEYKKDAADFWKTESADPFLIETEGPRRAFSYGYGMRSDGREVTQVTRIDGDLWRVALKFDPKTGWANDWKPLEELPEGARPLGTTSAKLEVKVEYDDAHPAHPASTLLVRAAGTKKTVRIVRPAYVYSGFETRDSLGWYEHQLAVTRVCFARKPILAKPKISCPVQATVPHKLQVLGTRPTAPGSGLAAEIWLADGEEKLTGTVYDLEVFDAHAKTLRKVKRFVGRPLSVAFTSESDRRDGGDFWLLLGERNQRTIRRYGPSGDCKTMLTFKDHILDMLGVVGGGAEGGGQLVLSLYAGDEVNVMRLRPDRLEGKPCRKDEGQTSPLQYAMMVPDQIDLKTALAGADLWTKEPQVLAPDEEKALFDGPALDKDRPRTGHVEAQSQPAKWRPRPLFLFPWIGADDALGPQIGVVSVPLMDEMQNETVRATFLVGAASHFPYEEVALTSTRFTPTLNLAAYRQQTFNGVFRGPTPDTLQTSFLDEKGVRLESDTGFHALGGVGSFDLGVKYAYLKPYIGPTLHGRGFLTEPSASLGITHAVWRLSLTNSVSGRVAPKSLNKRFDYNELGAASTLTLALPVLDAKTSVGVEGSRMRGEERRDFRELYRPLKTFVPGTGGGYNQNSYPLVDQGGLFSAVYGDTQARAKANLTVPVLPDLDKYLWILYLERLDFTAFYNYGAAWNGEHPRVGWNKLIRAHGYDLDLQLENKGVRFNLGAGTGQVVGRPFEVYLTTGFDALF